MELFLHVVLFYGLSQVITSTYVFVFNARTTNKSIQKQSSFISILEHISLLIQIIYINYTGKKDLRQIQCCFF